MWIKLKKHNEKVWISKSAVAYVAENGENSKYGCVVGLRNGCKFDTSESAERVVTWVESG